MARNLAAAGYESVRGSIFAPPKVTAKIVYNYQTCTLTPQIAQSNFFSDDELFCGARVIFGVEQDLDLFGMETDINESPEVQSGVGMDTSSLTICQSRKFQWKLSHSDQKMMCSNLSLWEDNVRKQVSKNIAKLIDAYSMPKIIASAHPDNVGTKAGMLTHDINLGDQGQNALDGNTKQGFEDMVLNIQNAAIEAGWMCGEGEGMGDGDSVSRPVLLIPSQLRKYALQNLKDLNTCCGDDNAMVTGKISTNFYGFEVIATRWLTPMQMGGAGLLAPVVAIDPNKVLHAFDFIKPMRWYEGKFEDYLVSEFAWDTSVINPYGVVVAISKI